ncbi:hypothetical protein Val02_86460 [Virgisporangium aliadipatigenens]|uniref:Secreted protein n=1 Tax=Virgisporangium aliadipatigenens TaxID=741659 RepID=A0A8J4DUX7_9ACTN|nr:hypothetical protein Val02_86460 [Virgisporangium aliadipatigenens]
MQNAPVTSTEAHLDRLRGDVAPVNHNARTIAALTGNPGCRRRAVLDAAGVDKKAMSVHIGHPVPFGQSTFAITRGNAFEAQVKANGCAELLTMLRERLGLDIAEVAYNDLEEAGGNGSREVRHALARRMIDGAAAGVEGAGTLFDHPLLGLPIGGRTVYLEPDLIAFQVGAQFHIIEIKSFPVIDGQADGGKVAAAAVQSAVYVLALRRLFEELGHDPQRVSHNVILVCPENFSNRPVATLLDVRRQLTVLKRQLSRLRRVDELLATLDPGLTFDLGVRDGTATRPAGEVVAALGEVEARYSPDCLDMCELSYFCRAEARGTTHALGRTVREELGGIEFVDTALRLAEGRLAPTVELAETAHALRTALRMRTECLS